MLKRNLCKKVLSGILAATLVMTSALTGIVAAPMSAEAAASYKNTNLLVNPDFEDGKAFSPAGGSHAGNEKNGISADPGVVCQRKAGYGEGC